MQRHLQLQSSVQRFDIAFAIKKISFYGALFKRILAWKRSISERQFFHLPYSKYKSVKICFYPCRYQNQNFSLVLHSCRSCSTRVVLVALVSLVSHLYRTRVASVELVSLVSGTGVVN